MTEAFAKRWPAEKEQGTPDIPWLSVDEGLSRLREIPMLEELHGVKPYLLHWTKDMLLTNFIRLKMVRAH